MSGHSKWSTIKHKKAAIDAKRGRIFSRLSKEIMLAARNGGGDPEMNPALRTAISNAKNVNMPNDNVDRAIKKGTGELGGDVLEELEYEGFAAGGVAILVECLSDNRNRTAAEIRTIFSRAGNTLAGPGAVSRLFSRKARFVIEGENADEMKLLEVLLEAGVDAEDVWAEDGSAEIIAPPEAFNEVLAALEQAGIQPNEAGVAKVADVMTPVSDAGVARQVTNFVDQLEEQDEVRAVTTNADFTDEVIAQLSAEE